MLDDSGVSDKLTNASSIAGLEKCRFSYGQGMQKQWVENISVFLDFVGSRCSQSAKASLETGELVVTEVDKKYLKKFDAEDQEKTYLAGLKH